MMVLAAFSMSLSFDSFVKVTVRLFFSVHLARMALILYIFSHATLILSTMMWAGVCTPFHGASLLKRRV